MIVGYRKNPTVGDILLREAGCEKIFSRYTEMQKELSEQDVIICITLKELGDSLSEIVNRIEYLGKKEIYIKSIEEKVDTRIAKNLGYILKIALKLNNTSSRNAGRHTKLSELQIEHLRKLYKTKNYSIKQLCHLFNIGKTTLFKWAK